MVLRHPFLLQLAVAIVASLTAFELVIAQQFGTNEASSQVLFSYDRQNTADSDPSPNEAVQPLVSAPVFVDRSNQSIPQTLPPAPLPGPVMHFDTDVAPASHVEVQDENSIPARRRLAPPSRTLGNPTEQDDREARPHALPFKVPNLDSLGTAGTGLALVVGLFLLCVSLVRKSKPHATTPLPSDAVAVLGRVPLAGRHFAQLIQVGTKLVLVAVTPDSIQTITEVTEPAEVERLLALCIKSNSRSTSAEFQRILQQISKEPARGFLGK